MGVLSFEEGSFIMVSLSRNVVAFIFSVADRVCDAIDNKSLIYQYGALA